MATTRRFPLYHALWRSFYCPKIYEYVAQHWRWRGLTYLVLLSFITVLPLALAMKSQLSSYMETEAPHFWQQWPDVVIEAGQASSTVEQPYFIYDEAGNRLMAIDTTGALSNPKDADVTALLTRDSLMVEIMPGDMQTASLSGVDYLLIDEAQVTEWWHMLENLMLPLGIPVLTGSAFIYRLFQAGIYAVVGMVMVSVLRIQLTFPAVFQITVLALTPSIALLFLMHGLNMQVPGQGLIVFAAAMGYIWFGVQAAAADQIAKQRS